MGSANYTPMPLLMAQQTLLAAIGHCELHQPAPVHILQDVLAEACQPCWLEVPQPLHTQGHTIMSLVNS